MQETSRRRRRPGVHAGHEHYKWWALSCTSLGMLLATINSGTLIIALPDLERALHTSLLSLVWVILAYMIASTVLVLTAGPAVRPVRPQAAPTWPASSLFALASLGAGFAADGTQLIMWRILQGIGAAFLFANAAALVTDAFPREQLGARDGHQHHGRRRRPGPRPGARRRAGRDLVALGVLVQRPARAPRRRSGAALVLHELAKPDAQRGLDLLGTTTFRRRPDRARARRLARAASRGWNDPLVIGGLIAAAVLLPLFVLIERARARADARPHDLPRTACSPPPPPRRSSTGCRASR